MRQRIKTLLCAAALVCLSMLAQERVRAQSARPSPLIGIDHIPLAVRSLEPAAEKYRQLGFALKPGRFHENGIRNMHVKFPDGSGIELITADKATDELTTRYLELLDRAEGPVFLSFHARDSDRFVAALDAGGIGHSRKDGYFKVSDPQLNFIFFGRDNRSSTDRPEHFAHPNSAVAMTAVWIASNDTSSLRKLLAAVGSVASQETVFVPAPTTATVFAVTNGKVILLPESYQYIKGRPLVGASFRVSSLDTVSKTLSATNISRVEIKNTGRSRELHVPPQAAHGIWLRFSER